MMEQSYNGILAQVRELCFLYNLRTQHKLLLLNRGDIKKA